MNIKLLMWILFFPLVLFFLVMFYIELSLNSPFPPEHGGMSFLIELKKIWFRSVWFYALLVILSFLLCFSFLHKRK